MKTTPQEIWSEYQTIIEYLNSRNVFSTVEQNENFYEGKQWVGLDSKSNMPRPVFNVLQRAGKFMVATLGSNDIAISMTPFSSLAEDIDKMRPIAKEVENVIEVGHIKENSKLAIRDAFVDGQEFMLLNFNPDVETGQPVKGIIESKLIDITNMMFGNPYSRDIQSQPWIIVALRQYISQVKEEAKSLGLSKEEIDNIKADYEENLVNDDSQNLVTVLLKFFKKKTVRKEKNEIVDPISGIPIETEIEKESVTVWFTKCTQDVTLVEPTDLGYKRYPIACFGWDPVKNSYLYTSPMTSNIVNQIFINKSFAIAQMYGLQSSFPKIVFDKSKIDIKEFMESTDPTAVAGIEMMGKFLDFIKIPDFSNNIIDLAVQTIAQTKECMGVTDASLGNVRPDNTSAIIALQESSSIPLEIQKQQYYEFWEDIVRNIIDIMSCSYGVRQVMTEESGIATIDFSVLKDLNYNLKVEIGNGAQYSEIAQINTLDKLVQAGYITPDAYMKAVPSKYIPQKQQLLNSYYEQMQNMGTTAPPRGSNTTDSTVPL